MQYPGSFYLLLSGYEVPVPANQSVYNVCSVQWYPLYSLVLVRGGGERERRGGEVRIHFIHAVCSYKFSNPASPTLSPFFLSLSLSSSLAPSLSLFLSLSPSLFFPLSLSLLPSHLPQCLLTIHNLPLLL